MMADDKDDRSEAEVLYRGRVFTLERQEMLLPNGKKAVREIVRHPGAVVIIPRDAQGHLLVIEQYRPAIERTILEFPAGTLEAGEAPLECARREIQEEVGMRAEQWTELGTLFPAPGFCNELQHLFYAESLTPCDTNFDEDEVIRTLPLSVAEVESMIRSGEMLDAKSIAAFTRARLLELL